uniref:18S rRNA (guanine-N(7))-methyltransferase n=1 Tax=Phallusia mammillata TaxID=59560 RepID=A0A6F9D8F8_9ASCI|nr:probable 18S rRNA (guanine-N(7))-methyltransferase [Phallusia mammillata]
MTSKRRPEHQAPPEIFYNEEEAMKYTTNSRMIEIQSEMSERAIELLNLPEGTPCLILDVGCGSGLSGECLTEHGHEWFGMDISAAMLNVAREREIDGDVVLADAGQGVSFRPGTFDGVISISALQWLCNADKKYHKPQKRLYTFFSTLYASMKNGSRAVFQIYPENPQQLELITTQSVRAGFGGGVVVDYPNSTKAKKIFLCLFCGNQTPTLPQGLGTGESSQHVKYTQERSQNSFHKRQSIKKSRDWIAEKKERRKRQGKSVRPNTKYTGRKRKTHF